MSIPSPAISAHLIVSNAAAAIDFYKRAFGAVEVRRVPAEDGQRLMHAELTVGPSILYLCDDFPEMCGGKSRTPQALGGTPLVLHRHVPSEDEAIERAREAGAKVLMPAADMFWGDRYGQVEDPFGHQWSFTTSLKK